MNDLQLLNEILGTNILEVRTKFLLLDYEIHCDNIITYLKLSSEKWISLIISDGKVDIAILNLEPSITSSDPESDFEYRIQKYSWQISSGISKVSYVVSKNDENHYFGLLFSFEDGQSISFLDDDDCIIIGPIEPWLDNCKIKEIDFSD